MKLLMEPPLTTVRSLASKSDAASLRVNVSVAVSPAFKLLLLLLTNIVGTTVSTVIVTVLFESAPSAFWFPLASVNLPFATVTTAAVVLLAVGVKDAV